MFKIKKTAAVEPKDIRLAVPAEVWQALEIVAQREGVEWQEVARQALAHALRSEVKELRRSSQAVETPTKGRKPKAAPGTPE